MRYQATGMCLMPPMKFERRYSTSPSRLDVGQAASELVEDQAQLHAGQVGAEAEVGPPPPKAMCSLGERSMSKANGLVEHGLVAVGRDVPHDDLVAGLDLLAAELVVLQRGAAEVHHRRGPAQDLLDGARQQARGRP